MNTIVVLVLLAQLPGMAEPIVHERQMMNIGECMKEIRAFLNLPPNVVLLEGGQIQATCVVRIPKAIEH